MKNDSALFNWNRNYLKISELWNTWLEMSVRFMFLEKGFISDTLYEEMYVQISIQYQCDEKPVDAALMERCTVQQLSSWMLGWPFTGTPLKLECWLQYTIQNITFSLYKYIVVVLHQCFNSKYLYRMPLSTFWRYELV